MSPAKHGLAIALLVRCLAPVQTPELRRELWPNGEVKLEVEVLVDPSGDEIRQGRFRSWSESGVLLSEGKFEQDQETGRWKLHHEDGALAAEGSYSKGQRTGPWESFHPEGTRESKGKYVKGVRDGAWSFWRADGTPDPVHSGVYDTFEVHEPDGSRLFRGALLDGQRHGEWRSYWPDLEPQLVASYVRGKREGPWRFHHQGGGISTLILSGVYHDDRWVGPLPAEDVERDPASRRRPPAPLALDLEAPPEDFGAAMEALLAASDAEAEQIRRSIHEDGFHPWTSPAAIPAVISRMLALDPEQPEDRRSIGRLDSIAMRSLCRGHGLVASGLAGPPDAEAARELVSSWASLWAATRTEPWFWRLELPLGSPPATLAAGREWLQEPELLEGRRPVPPLFAVRAGGSAALRAACGPAAEQALLDALAWLEAHQSADGSWSGPGFRSECGKLGATECAGPGKDFDVGLTGLALLAFLGAGSTLESGPHREVVERALVWLLERQDPLDGQLKTITETRDGEKRTRWFHTVWLHEHAYATAALCEALATSRSAALRARAAKAVEVIVKARNPYHGWRYALPPDGDNDTAMTGEMVLALRLAMEAGLEADFEALFGGALSWIDEVSDPASGRVGYDSLGSLSSRTPDRQHFPREKGEALTALALLSRIFMGQGPDETPILNKHAELLAQLPPVWDPDGYGSDMYYWFFATYALYQMGKPYWPAWEKAMKAAIVDSQRKDGDEKGSWDPIDPWGAEGGRVYSTALMALCLEVHSRYARLREPEPARRR